jgi:hypothetical protein
MKTTQIDNFALFCSCNAAPCGAGAGAAASLSVPVTQSVDSARKKEKIRVRLRVLADTRVLLVHSECNGTCIAAHAPRGGDLRRWRHPEVVAEWLSLLMMALLSASAAENIVVQTSVPGEAPLTTTFSALTATFQDFCKASGVDHRTSCGKKVFTSDDRSVVATVRVCFGDYYQAFAAGHSGDRTLLTAYWDVDIPGNESTIPTCSNARTHTSDGLCDDGGPGAEHSFWSTAACWSLCSRQSPRTRAKARRGTRSGTAQSGDRLLVLRRGVL